MNEKGVALPTAMIVLVVLVALAMAFLVLAASEPQMTPSRSTSQVSRTSSSECSHA